MLDLRKKLPPPYWTITTKQHHLVQEQVMSEPFMMALCMALISNINIAMSLLCCPNKQASRRHPTNMMLSYHNRTRRPVPPPRRWIIGDDDALPSRWLRLRHSFSAVVVVWV